MIDSGGQLASDSKRPFPMLWVALVASLGLALGATVFFATTSAGAPNVQSVRTLVRGPNFNAAPTDRYPRPASTVPVTVTSTVPPPPPPPPAAASSTKAAPAAKESVRPSMLTSTSMSPSSAAAGDRKQPAAANNGDPEDVHVPNTLGRVSTGEICNGRLTVPTELGYPHEGLTLCRVDDLTGSPVEFWHGFWAAPAACPEYILPAPLNGSSGGPIHPFLPYTAPAAAAVLRLTDGCVVAKTGLIYSATSVYTNTGAVANTTTFQASSCGDRYAHAPQYPYFPRSDNVDRFFPVRKREVRLAGRLLTLIMPYNNLFQHFVFDTLPRVDLVLPFLTSNPDVRILHSGDVMPSFLLALGLEAERLIEAKPDAVYRADTLLAPLVG